MASLKPNCDKLDIDKLKNVSTDLNNLKSDIDKLDACKLKWIKVVKKHSIMN